MQQIRNNIPGKVQIIVDGKVYFVTMKEYRIIRNILKGELYGKLA